MVNANVNSLFESAANLQKNVETVGGKLQLFSDKLIFQPHKVNIQREPITITLSDITDTYLGWTKLFGIIPLLPNAIVITTNENKLFRFTVFHRNEWLSKINDILN